METEGIAARLLRGSQNIDRMKAEVEQVVKTVMGLVYLHEWGDLVYEWKKRSITVTVFTSSKVRWELEDWGDRGGFRICCWTTVAQDCATSQLAYSSLKGETPFRSRDTQFVYEDLDTFVNGMCELFPGLKERLSYLLEAAEVKF